MEGWQQESSQYDERLSRLRGWQPNLSGLVERLPHIPLSYTPTPEGLVALQVSLFTAAGCVPFAFQSLAAFLILWQAGLLTAISLPTRLAYELWGGAHFARRTLDEMRKSGNIEAALARTQRLLTGARPEVDLPWGGTASEKSIHVMDFVRSLADVCPGAEKTYAFLCESCHPSHLRLSTWFLAGPPVENWSNPRFRQEAHRLIDRTVDALERSLEGIAVDARNALELALPYIERDQPLESS